MMKIVSLASRAVRGTIVKLHYTLRNRNSTEGARAAKHTSKSNILCTPREYPLNIMPFLVQIFAGGKRKRVDEGDMLLSVVSSSSSSKRRNKNAAGGTIITTASASSTARRKNNCQDAGKERE